MTDRRGGVAVLTAWVLFAALTAATASAQSSVVLPTRTGAPVVVATSASALAVARIPVPSSFPLSARVNYTVTPMVEGALVGPLTGSVNATPAPSDRSILFAVRSPRNAFAGRVQVGVARFSTSTAAVEVAIFADVAPIRALDLQPASAVVPAVAGQAVRVGLRVANTGNTTDTLSLSAVVPVGWRVDEPAPIALSARQAVDRVIAILPPPGATGAATIRLVASSRQGAVADGQVEVLLPRQPTGSAGAPGPTLRTGAAAASGPWPGVSAIQSAELQGLLSDGISVLARASTTPGPGAAGYAFTRANVASMPFLLTLSGTDWRADGGTIGSTVSELTGVNLVGRGASAVVMRSSFTATAFRATPDLGGNSADGSFSAARLEYAPGDFAVSGAAASLREERGGVTRSLDSWSLGARRHGLLGGRWDAEVARRAVAGRAHAGWSAAYERRLPDENLSVRYVHAPGGTAAFARATSELSVDGGRRLTDRVQVTASAWRTRDDGAATLSALDLDGWSAAGRLALTRDVAVSVIAHRSAFSASTSLGAFGSAERAIDAQVEHRRGPWSAQVTLSTARLQRRGALDGESVVRFAQEAPRSGLRGLVGLHGHPGTIAFTGQYERTGAGVGAAPEQWSYGLQVSGRPGLLPGDALRFDAALERAGGSFGLPPATTIRVAADLDLPQRVTVRAGVERNPWVLPEPGRSPWMYVVGVTRATTLPRLSSGEARGLVYRDENGNGRRDGGEAGFEGVAVRRGPDVAVTDRRGEFRLPGGRDPIEVDARSLPPGWLLPSTVLAPGTREAGAVAVAPVSVLFLRGPADSGRVARADLAALLVIARDGAGREWVARRTSDSSAVFDALPPGRYTIEVDASAAREPLRPEGDVPAVTVAGGVAPAPVRITMRARQLRFPTPKRGTP